jgi:hypothetical protein
MAGAHTPPGADFVNRIGSSKQKPERATDESFIEGIDDGLDTVDLEAPEPRKRRRPVKRGNL